MWPGDYEVAAGVLNGTPTASPRITVVTVCYNAAALIEATLRSVLAQDYDKTEYVVIDGGSSDGTMDIVARYSKNIAAVVSERDSGVYDAMNKGVRRASGDYILFMNAGDVFASPRVLREAGSATDAADVLYGDFSYSDGPRKGRIRADIERGVFNHQCILYRRSLHERFGGYFSVPGLTAADYLFFMYLYASGKVSFRKLDLEFAVVDARGMSAGLQTFLQVNLIDALLSRRGRYATAFRIAVHPAFNLMRSLVRRR